MTDQEKSKAIERANAYRDMMNMWAWKDLMAQLKETNETKISSLLHGRGDLESVRGFNAALESINTQVSFCLEGGVALSS